MRSPQICHTNPHEGLQTIVCPLLSYHDGKAWVVNCAVLVRYDYSYINWHNAHTWGPRVYHTNPDEGLQTIVYQFFWHHKGTAWVVNRARGGPLRLATVPLSSPDCLQGRDAQHLYEKVWVYRLLWYRVNDKIRFGTVLERAMCINQPACRLNRPFSPLQWVIFQHSPEIPILLSIVLMIIDIIINENNSNNNNDCGIHGPAICTSMMHRWPRFQERVKAPLYITDMHFCVIACRYSSWSIPIRAAGPGLQRFALQCALASLL